MIVQQGIAFLEGFLKISSHVGQRLELHAVDIILLGRSLVLPRSPCNSIFPSIVGDFFQLLQAMAERLDLSAKPQILEI